MPREFENLKVTAAATQPALIAMEAGRSAPLP